MDSHGKVMDRVSDSSSGTVAMITDATVSDSSLLTVVMQEVLHDAFLTPVVRRVKESENGTWCGFFTGLDTTPWYQREGDVMMRSCVPSKCRVDVMWTSHGRDLLTSYPDIDRTLAEITRYWYWSSLSKDVAHFCRSCRLSILVHDNDVRFKVLWKEI